MQSGKHYLVTGGAGFIGHHLVVRLLEAGHRVRVLDDLSTGLRDNLPPLVEFIHGDIASRDVVEKAMQGVDGCFHLAAISSVERTRLHAERSHDVNYNGTAYVMDAAAAQQIPVAYASSAAVYGAVETLPVTEDVPTRPINLYGEDKLGGEHYAQAREKSKGLVTASIRIFNCFGKGQRSDSLDSGVIARFCDLAQQRQPITIYGDGRQTRDFIYVSDVVALFISAMERLRSQKEALVLNACTQKRTSLLELVDALSQALGYPVQANHEPARVDSIVHSLGSAEKASLLLGWKAQESLASGLEKLLRH